MSPAGWPKPLEVVPARVGPLRASIKGDALYGTVCGRDYTLTLTTADQFGNPRCAPPLPASCPAGMMIVVWRAESGVGCVDYIDMSICCLR